MRKREPLIIQKAFLSGLDIVLVNMGMGLAFMAHYGARSWMEMGLWNSLFHIAPVLSLSTLLVFYISDLYTNWLHHGHTQVAYCVISGLALAWMVVITAAFWSRQELIPRSIMMMAAPLQFVLVASFRLAALRAAKSRLGHRRLLVIGENEAAAATLARKFSEHANGWYTIYDSISSSDLRRLERTLREVDVVLVSSNVTDKREITHQVIHQHKELYVIPGIFEFCIIGSEVRKVDDVLLLAVRSPHLSAFQSLTKRVCDMVGAMIGIVASAPLLVLVAAAVRLTSKGPVIFRQERLGQHGKPYNLYKFRTMVADAEKHTGPVLATANDARITPLGRVLRSTRIDELPQFFNVLLGHMSLVGPRPERKFFTQQFERSLPSYGLRLAVKPGITGLAQAMAGYSTTAERKLRFDLLYIYDYSLVLDIKIILQTVWVVLQREQSRGLRETGTDLAAERLWKADCRAGNLPVAIPDLMPIPPLPSGVGTSMDRLPAGQDAR